MKTKTLGRIVVLALALCLISTSLMGGTLAKYTTEVTGTGTTNVAKWAVAFKADEGATTTSTERTTAYTFTLGDTRTDAEGTLVATDRIAPGSTGSIAVEIDGTGSEVPYTWSITANYGDLPSTIKFYQDSGYTTVLTSGSGWTGDVALNAVGTAVTKTIYWKWVTETDAADTTIGIVGDTDTFTVVLKAEQKTS